jgi:hypothetical protein
VKTDLQIKMVTNIVGQGAALLKVLVQQK